MKVSVIVPVYGVEKYIKRCATSLFEQTLDSIEYIFIDDCSKDNSIEVLTQLIEEYKLRLLRENKVAKIVRMSKNSGQAAVRKRGVLLSTGEYIIHCDSDDWVDCNLYERMYESAKRNGSDVVVCDYMESDGYSHKHVDSGKSMPTLDYLSAVMHKRYTWAVWNKLIKRNLYNENFEFPTGDMGEDMCITLQLIANCEKISFVKGAYYYYFLNQSSICNTISREKCITKYKQFSENFSIIDRQFNKNKHPHNIELGLYFLSYFKTDSLKYLLRDNMYSKVWEDNVKHKSIKVFLNRNLSLKDRLIALATYLGLYGFINRIRKNNT